MKTVLQLLVCFTSLFGFSQTKISGAVQDEFGQPIYGANIFIKGTYDGTISDVKGNFEFETYNLNYELTTINDSIVNQTVLIARKLNDWTSGTNDDNENINSFKFLAIKVINGEIKEILPK